MFHHTDVTRFFCPPGITTIFFGGCAHWPGLPTVRSHGGVRGNSRSSTVGAVRSRPRYTASHNRGRLLGAGSCHNARSALRRPILARHAGPVREGKTEVRFFMIALRLFTCPCICHLSGATSSHLPRIHRPWRPGSGCTGKGAYPTGLHPLHARGRAYIVWKWNTCSCTAVAMQSSRNGA